jgi:hypothetical protein
MNLCSASSFGAQATIASSALCDSRIVHRIVDLKPPFTCFQKNWSMRSTLWSAGCSDDRRSIALAHTPTIAGTKKDPPPLAAAAVVPA